MQMSTTAATFSLQHTLPRLPVPSLEATCARYLYSLRPLLTDTEFKESERKVNDFLTSPLSKQLQERLIDLERSSTFNWLDDTIWLSKAYHEWREPLLVNSNWYILGIDDPRHPKDLLVNGAKRPSGDYTYYQVRRAAHMIYEALDFKGLIDRWGIFSLSHWHVQVRLSGVDTNHGHYTVRHCL